MNHRIKRHALAGLTMTFLAASPARAGEGLERLSSLFAKKSEAKAVEEPRPAPVSSTLNWWSIPRPAREAAKKLAASKDASVTRCVAIPEGDQVTYEIHAARRAGLFKKAEFVLTRVTESEIVAEKRREAQSLRGRLKRLRNLGKPVDEPVWTTGTGR